jgi:glycosyltransferase involved in cell wall biosynthesis
MQILTIAERLTTRGGLERVHLDLSRGLAERGHLIDLLFTEEGDASKSWSAVARVRQQTVCRVDLKPSRVGRSVKGVVAAATFGARRHPDVIYAPRHVQLAHAVTVGILTGAPVVCHIHTPPPRERILPLHLAVLNRVARFAMVSEFTARQWIDAGLRAGSVEVVHNGVDLDAFEPSDQAKRHDIRASLGIPDDAFLVLYAGRLDPKKGVDVLLQAWRRLGLSPGEGRLVILGDPSFFLSRTKADDLGSSLREMSDPTTTLFVGHRPDPAPLFGAADVVAVPSRWPDPFPLVVLEAMACGTPVVASRVGGIPEAVAGPFPSHLVEPGSVDALAERLAALRGWRSTDPALGKRCRQHIVSHFPFRRTLDAVEGLLSSVCEEQGRTLPVRAGSQERAPRESAR